MGIFGAGNSGAAVNKFVAPALVVAFGWAMVPQVYAVVDAGDGGAVLDVQLPATRRTCVARASPGREQLRALKDPTVMEVLPVLLDRVRRLRRAEPVDGPVLHRRVRPRHPHRGAAGRRASRCRAACCAPSAAGCRDKYGAHSVTWWVMWVELDLPVPAVATRRPTSPSTPSTGRRPSRSASTSRTFTVPDVPAGHRLGLRQGLGVQVHRRRLSRTTSASSRGIVGLAGGLGGFVLPIMFGALMDLTGIRSSAFMLMYGVVWVSLIWMYWTEVRTHRGHGPRARRPRRPPASNEPDLEEPS